jgi:anti-anti-sigma factor
MSDAFQSPFAVIAQSRGDSVCIVLVGELDLAYKGRTEREVLEQIERGCTAVELDLRELTFIDSSGVQELLRCRELAAGRDVRLSLSIVPGAVQRALEICGVLGSFDVEVHGGS